MQFCELELVDLIASVTDRISYMNKCNKEAWQISSNKTNYFDCYPEEMINRYIKLQEKLSDLKNAMEWYEFNPE